MVTPFIEAHENIKQLCEELGYSVYEFLPDDVEYPFVFVGEQFFNDEMTKWATIGEVNSIIHVYHHHEEVAEAYAIIAKINAAIHEKTQTEHFEWHAYKSEGYKTFDGTTSNAVVHCVLDIKQKYKTLGGN